MPIIAKAQASNFMPPPPGTHAAVCVDIVDLGMLEVSFGGKNKKQHKIRVVWQLAEVRHDNKPFEASKRYTLSLHEKAALRKDLESWRGRPFTAEELEGFDLEKLLGAAALLNIIEEKKADKTYANIASIMRLPKGMESPTPRDYVRVVDRKQAETPADEPPQYPEEWGAGITDDDVPF